MLVFTVLCPEYVLSIFTPDKKMTQSSFHGLLVITLATVIAVPADAYYSALEGTGDTRITLLIEIIIALCSLAYAWYAAFYLGLALEYILVSEIIGWTLCLLLSWLCFRNGSWQRLKI
jgi:Na+-driven multidrug efflux pump